MTETVEIRALAKTFGTTRALDGLDMSVHAGEVHGFLGPNGAGKSTTLRVLLGLVRPDAGTVRLLGQDPWHRAVELHRRMVYVPGDVTLWPTLTGGEVIDLLGRLRGGADRQRRDDLVRRFALDPGKRCRTYSTGNRQKVALVAALASDAELLVLDEPTAGLDPLMEAVFRECVAEERARGRTVLLSSHILGEVEAVCDRVTIIRDGATVEAGTLAQLRHLTRSSVSAEVAAAPSGLSDLAGVHDLRTEGHQVRCQVDTARIGDVLVHLHALGIVDVTVQPPTLEELFLRHYQAEPAGEGEVSGVSR
ncbi:ABC-2 type transport system ATP-binding protein [Lipingzhangella halophila]|uniref:ABC-2 type transport system ATP-binding protein n=1 Tax=Lipingzhangella halophila TaxID=1783352 RepID=A0A7W7RGX2_9ACTN|nr:ABC transporter ATP-binding protein [Lipingzhangella halophila]MBB4931765.1 ABC-2 type transport system ATP-binding protein [Lipingzhangella halophila]